MSNHSTLHLQPLDVGVFDLYQPYYSNAVDTETRLSHGLLNTGKHFEPFFGGLGHGSNASQAQQSGPARPEAALFHSTHERSVVF